MLNCLFLVRVRYNTARRRADNQTREPWPRVETKITTTAHRFFVSFAFFVAMIFSREKTVE